MRKIKPVNVKAKTYRRVDEKCNEYTETEFWYADYGHTQLIDFKKSDSVIMSCVSYYDIKGGHHSLVIGTVEEIKTAPANTMDLDDLTGYMFKITKTSNCSVRVEEVP